MTSSRLSLLMSALSVMSVWLPADAQECARISSPDGKIEVRLAAGDSDGKLRYEVTLDGVTIISPSATGLEVAGTLPATFTSVPETERLSGDETYTMPHGKTHVHKNRYNEIAVSAETPQSVTGDYRVRFRVYDDAVAFRYEISDAKNLKISSDLSEFNIATFRKSWAQCYHKDYSWYYEPRDWEAMRATESYNVPVLVDCGSDNYILLTEAASTSAMSASAVTTADVTGHLRLRPAAESTIGEDNFVSPWRVMLIGSLADIVESDRMPDFNVPSEIDDLSWIKPGRVAWNWGAEDGDSAPTLEQAKRYIDMAASMGWEYFLLDDGWDGRLDLGEVTAYAESKNVGLLIWSHQNRFLNNYTQIYNIFSQWSRMGIKGVKIDFFEDDSQQMLRKYENILRAAAQCRLMVNFHGCTKPSGLERTWPNLMTSEAVLGGEFYMFNTTMTPGSHTVNLALTRNVLGGMDYTPVKFGNKNGRVITNTTWAYQLALSVTVESSLQSFCDTPENIIGSMAEPFLRQVPVTWDELRCLEALPDSHVTLARRSGSDWWIGTLTQDARTVSLPLSFLSPGVTYHAHIYTEGFHRSDISYECVDVTASDHIELTLGENSGAAIRITADDSCLYPFAIKMEAEKYNRYCDRVNDTSCSGGVALSNLGGARRKIEFTGINVPEDGEYSLTLFYMTSAESSCYVAVNEGEKEYHTFRNTGNALSFVRIPVTLRKGDNTITLGNENGQVPTLSFDRAVVSRVQSDGIKSGIKTHAMACSPIEVSIRDGRLWVDAPQEGIMTVYTTTGVRIQSHDVKAGANEYRLSYKGPVIVNIVTSTKSISKKLIIK